MCKSVIGSSENTVIDAPVVARTATRTCECRLKDSKCSPCGPIGHLRAVCKSAHQTQQVESGDIPEASQDEADVGEVWVVMARTVPETSCSAGSETACSDGDRVRTFAQTLVVIRRKSLRSRAHLHVQ